jgi:hypothetical protein
MDNTAINKHMDTKINQNHTEKKPDEKSGIYLQGHIKIWDPETKEVYVDKRNAIHYENFSVCLAQNAANKGSSFITEMHFGNGGTTVDPTGVITYLPTNTNVQNANLYNPTYYKLVDNTNAANPDPLNNKMVVNHTPGLKYTDIVVGCLLDYGEPSGQAVFDNSQNLNGDFVFDELGLFGYVEGSNGLGGGLPLLTHVIFSPVQKALNRLIQIEYTVRVQTLTNLTA